MNIPEYLTKMDKTHLSVVDLREDTSAENRNYWLSKTPTERFIALELLRQQLYGYDSTTERMEKVIEVVDSDLNNS
ncbi:MAG: hypothetical protein KGZ58_08925 [Ignavibacteriales bacterium]|nr:hypothetical protein [Ignavibacteriales bacterium]